MLDHESLKLKINRNCLSGFSSARNWSEASRLLQTDPFIFNKRGEQTRAFLIFILTIKTTRLNNKAFLIRLLFFTQSTTWQT